MTFLNKKDPDYKARGCDASEDALLNGSPLDTIRKIYEDDNRFFGNGTAERAKEYDEPNGKPPYILWFGTPEENDELMDNAYLRLYADGSWNMDW